ncbi:hypothetical protein [Caminibacter sp.]
MKKFVLISLGVAALFAFNMVPEKQYTCITTGITFSEGNQTRSIPVTPKTKPILEKSLKNFFEIKVKRFTVGKGQVDIKVGNDEQNLTYVGKWKGYDRYQDAAGQVVFMPDKNASTNNAALIIPSQKLVIFYQCR